MNVKRFSLYFAVFRPNIQLIESKYQNKMVGETKKKRTNKLSDVNPVHVLAQPVGKFNMLSV